MSRLLRLVGCASRRHYPPPGTALAAAGLAAAGLALAGSWLARLRRVTVVGHSMEPALQPGDRLLVIRTRRVANGQLVALRDPRHPQRELVKRVLSVEPGRLVVVGDNGRASTDSRSFGPVPRHLLVGRVVYRYLPEKRRGRL